MNKFLLSIILILAFTVGFAQESTIKQVATYTTPFKVTYPVNTLVEDLQTRITYQLLETGTKTIKSLSNTNKVTWCGESGSSISLTTNTTRGASTYNGSILNIPVYQGEINLTTLGTSGVSTFNGTTLNVPNYQTGGSISLTTTNTSGASTYNGTTLNIPVYQGQLNGTGKVTATGTSISYDNTTYQPSISLTTTGTSGTATFNGTTLNIPNYEGVQGVTGATGAGYEDLTSTTSIIIGTGVKTFTVSKDYSETAYRVGNRVRSAYASDVTKFVEGAITSFAGTTMSISSDYVGGSGTYTNWVFGIIGAIGATGANGSDGADGTDGVDGITGATGLGYAGLTSATSNVVGTGTKTFIVNQAQGTNAYGVGTSLRAAYTTTTTNFMDGIITAYSSTTLTTNMTSYGGSGTWTSWNISVVGDKGAIGVTGNNGVNSVAGTANEVQFRSLGNFAGSLSYQWANNGLIIGTSNTAYTTSYTQSLIGSMYLGGSLYYPYTSYTVGDYYSASTSGLVVPRTPTPLVTWLAGNTVDLNANNFTTNTLNSGTSGQIVQFDVTNKPVGVTPTIVDNYVAGNWTASGGYQVVMTNKTGGTSVAGTLVSISTANTNSVVTAPAYSRAVLGVINESGIADGSLVKVSVAGIVNLLLKDATTCAIGDYLVTSDVAGRAVVSTFVGNGIGYALQTGASGTNTVVMVNMSPNKYYNPSATNGDFLQYGLNGMIDRIAGQSISTFLSGNVIPNGTITSLYANDINGGSANQFLAKNGTNTNLEWRTPVNADSYVWATMYPLDINPTSTSANQFMQRKSDNSGVQWSSGVDMTTYTWSQLNSIDYNPSSASAYQFLQRKADNSGTQWTTGVSLDNYNFSQVISASGYQVVVTNKTGGTSITGTLTQCGTASQSVKTATTSSTVVWGVMIDNGVADGSNVKIQNSGIADVLMSDSTGTYPLTIGEWIVTGSSAGRGHRCTVNCIPKLNKYIIGQATETKTITTGTTAKIWLKL